jgi:hypothetical protein
MFLLAHWGVMEESVISALSDVPKFSLPCILASSLALNRRGPQGSFLPDFPFFDADELTLLPTASLIELAKRAIKGPKSWSASYHGMPKHIGYQQFFDPVIQPHFTGGSAKLLPGGRYTLENGTQLRCWSFPEGRMIWQHRPRDAESSYWIYDF